MFENSGNFWEISGKFWGIPRNLKESRLTKEFPFWLFFLAETVTLWRRSGEFPGNKRETFREILGNNLSDSLFALFIFIYRSIHRELRLTWDSRASRPYSSNRKSTSCDLKMLNLARAGQMQPTNSSSKRVQRTDKQISILIGFVTFAECVLNLSLR